MISQTAEYALRAVVWLAHQDRAAHGTSAIAERTLVPAGYLSKVLQELARNGLVVSTSGRHGGFRLARSASEISVLDVMQAVAPFERIRKCPLGIEAHNGKLCPLHRRLDEAMASMEKAFAATTIAELVQEQDAYPPLCDGRTAEDGRAESASTTVGQSTKTTQRGRRPKVTGPSGGHAGEEH